MRQTVNHTPPASTQPEPADNTSHHIQLQVSHWQATGELIHPQTAMEIAAWYASPSTMDESFTVMGQTGTITPDLADDITGEIDRLEDDASLDEDGTNLPALQALAAYISAIAGGDEDPECRPCNYLLSRHTESQCPSNGH